MKATNVKLNVTVVSDCEMLAKKALSLFINDGLKAIKAKQQFCVAVSRHTPWPFFELLGAGSQSEMLPWDSVHLFWADECCGAPDSGNNSYNRATHILVSKVGVPAENVHRIYPENRNCGCTASMYEETIYKVVGSGGNGMPRFDLIMLAMGKDGHIASLFPDTYAFFDTENLVRVIYFMDGRHTRITLTNPVLCAAFHIAVLVFGEERAAILKEVLTDKPDKMRYPIHAIWPVLDKVTWLVDRSAARFLRSCRLSR